MEDEDGRQWKRRRLDDPAIKQPPLSNSEPVLSPCVKGEIRRDCEAFNVHPDVAAFRAAEVDDSKTVNLVCYGMLENLPIISIPTAVIIDNPTLISAHLNEDGIVQRSSDEACVGKLEDRAVKCLSKFNAEDDIKIQLMLKTITCQRSRKRATEPVALASAIIYGPEDVSEEAGDFLDRCGYVLQDPFSCERNMPYKNPHCLSTLFETPRMTFELQTPDLQLDGFTVSNSLQALETTEDLPEWPQPAALKTELHRHQKQALRFFIDREGPKKMEHVWQARLLIDGSSTYVNEITSSYQTIPPPFWNGGILADEMGLGKTLEMISLIAADRELQRQPQEGHFVLTAGSPMATLVVVPLSLISVWEYQLGCHLHPSTLSWGRHHRKSRLISDLDSTCPDVVLTTYGTVQAEYKYKCTEDRILYGHQWRRIILDEAHVIRNRTATSTAISALRAISRWAITGTPIQNSFADIGGLLRFLHFSPYDNVKSFDEDVLEIFRRGDIEEGARRLKALCQPIMIRRSRSIISLPARQDFTKTVEFFAEERRGYQRIENSFQELPYYETSRSSEAHFSMSMIQLINKLRLFCNLGVCSITTPIVSEQTVETMPESEGSVNTVVGSDVALGETACKECSQIIDIADSPSTAHSSPYAYYSECCNLYCSSCVELSNSQTATGFSCCKESLCVLRPLSPTIVQVARNEQPLPDTYPAETSKIRALVQEIQSNLADKHVVFSFWTSSLTLAQNALTAAGIRCVRIDGSVSLLNRERTIQEFREDEVIKVILVTISCGGVGLDLTAASRVHLLEPQWNPASEEQALSRVHRMGQRHPVVTMRYVMKDSIEESIALVKGKKQLLAELLPQSCS